MKDLRKTQGFTIVELLIVIVVIGILAAITIVSFNGISNRAHLASLQSDLSSAASKLEQYRIQTSTSDQYPATLADGGIAASAGNTYSYIFQAADNSFCLTNTYNTTTYAISDENKTPTTGICGDDGLVARYNFNGNTNDATGNAANNGTNNNGATAVQGQNPAVTNGAYGFNGTSQNITIPTVYGLGASNVAVSVWAYSNAASNKGAFIKVGAGNGYAIGMGSTNMSTNGTTLLFLFEGVRWIYPGSTFTANAWHHIVLSIDGAGVPSLYLDGNLITRSTGTGASAPSTNTIIGGSLQISEDRFFNGRVDDAKIYKRALSDAEVKVLFATGAQ